MARTGGEQHSQSKTDVGGIRSTQQLPQPHAFYGRWHLLHSFWQTELCCHDGRSRSRTGWGGHCKGHERQAQDRTSTIRLSLGRRKARTLGNWWWCRRCTADFQPNNGRVGPYQISQLLTQHRINAEVVLVLVAEMLRAVSAYSKSDWAEFIRTVQETQTANIAKQKKRFAVAEKRAAELEKLICKIYEDNALGKLPDAR